MTDLVKQDKLQELVSEMNNALEKNQLSVTKAKAAGEKLIEKVEQNGMNETLDQECNQFLVKYKKTHAAVQERRKPITQLFDQVKKRFTEIEATLAPKGEIYTKIQGFRNTYAAQVAEEAKRKEEEARRKLAIEKEKSDVSAKIESGLSHWFNGYLSNAQQKLVNFFNKLTLENFEQSSAEIGSFPSIYPKTHFEQFTTSVTTVYLDKEAKQALKVQVMDGKYETYKAEFAREITELKNELIAKLPSKKNELETIAEAEKKNAEEAARLKAEREAREKADNERLAREAKEREKKAEEEAARKKQEKDMENLFNATAESSSPKSTAQVRTSFEIEVTNPAGYMQIFSLWFEREGMKLAMDKIEKKSIKQMKAFCEKLAGDGEKIDSPYIKYKEAYRAVAKAK